MNLKTNQWVKLACLFFFLVVAAIVLTGCEGTPPAIPKHSASKSHFPAIAEKPMPSSRNGYFGVYVCNEYFRPIEGCFVRVRRFRGEPAAQRMTGKDGLAWFEMNSCVAGCDMVTVSPGRDYQGVYDFEPVMDGGLKVMKLWRADH